MAAALGRNKRELQNLTAGFISAVVSVLLTWWILPLLSFPAQQESSLQASMEAVTALIGNLENLEQQLEDTKQEMIQREEARQKLEERYERARELGELTEEQLETINLALTSGSLNSRILEYALGFIIGVASSLMASVLWRRLQRRRRLSGDGGDLLPDDVEP